MQKVTTTEILHTKSNVNHELQECLSGQELRKKKKRTPVMRKLILFCLKSELFNTVCISVFGRNLTTGPSPRRERSRKLCRSPYFMNGRMTMGLGKCPESTSKHTPKEKRTSQYTEIIHGCANEYGPGRRAVGLYSTLIIHHSYQAV